MMENLNNYVQEDDKHSSILPVIISVLLALFISKVLVINAHIPSASMEPMIMTNDRLFGNRLAYLFKEPARGDVVIFYAPDEENVLFVKRIIGLPGESVQIKGGQVYIDNVAVSEEYLAEEPKAEDMFFNVPEGCYFVMGDNRNHSNDGRYWKNHYVSKDRIIAKAWFKYFPGFKIVK